MRLQYKVTSSHTPYHPGVAGLRAHLTGGAGYPPRLCRDGKRKLTESAKEFPKASARQRPKGSLREVQER